MSNMIQDDFPAKPYKGPQSYQSHDASLFFGREMEAEKLLSKILSARFSLLHAQSGAGKTSLLNARIIPQLEQRGWLPVRILPQNDPIESTWRSTLQTLLPPMETEAKAITRAIERLAKDGDDLTLDELLRRYDDLPDRDADKRELIAPMDLEKIVGKQYEQWLGGGQVTPFFCRLLRATSEIRWLNDHLGLFLVKPVDNLTMTLTGATPVSQILRFCSHPSLLEGYKELLIKLEAKNPLWGLLEKFENLFEVYSAKGISVKLTLIFDQFEEMFTRFVDPGQLKLETQDIPDWRLRWRFFDELQSLYFRGYGDAQSAEPEGDAILSALPIRYVVSMRSEWISRLDNIARFAPDIVSNAYHLDLLVKETARQAIQEPARQFGFGYENSLYDKIIDDLCKEMRFVEPTHLQIVCEKLWDARGRQLASELLQKANIGDLPHEAEYALVELEVYQNLDGAAGILKAFLLDYLESLDTEAKLMAIEMLEPLITISGTRNIVDYEQLVHSPFHKIESPVENASKDNDVIPSLGWRNDIIQHRQNCLANLINSNIVRMESRLGGQFVEITHEFLIDPIRKEVVREMYSNLSYRNFRQALNVFVHCEAMSLGIDMEGDFGQADFHAVNEYSELLSWSHWACELMLRRAIEYGYGKEVIAKWLERYGSLPSPGGLFEAALADMEKIEQEKRFDLTLGFKQLQAINSRRKELKNLSIGIVQVLFRSTLKHAKDAHYADIVYWSRRFYEQQIT